MPNYPYPSITGLYFAARLGVAEDLLKRRHTALMLREIRPEYVMPLGVWQVRERIRKAFDGLSCQFDNFQNAFSFESEWIRNSKIYKNRIGVDGMQAIAVLAMFIAALANLKYHRIIQPPPEVQ